MGNNVRDTRTLRLSSGQRDEVFSVGRGFNLGRELTVISLIDESAGIIECTNIVKRGRESTSSNGVFCAIDTLCID